MRMNWESFVGKTVNITMYENFGIVRDPGSDTPIYEIVFKAGTLVGAYDEGLLLDTRRDAEQVKVFVFYNAIKCVEVYNY